MSVEANKQLISALIDEVWNEHDPAAVARFFGPGLREEIAEHQRQLLGGFPDLRVTVEDDLIADGELVVARLTLTGTISERSPARPPPGGSSPGRRSGSTG